MSDNGKEQEQKTWEPSSDSVSGLRKMAILYLVGGVVLGACRLVAGKLVITFLAGGIISALGIGWLMANNPNNKKTGALITGVGILVMLSGVRISILPIITGTALSIITIGSLVLGVKHLILYFIAKGKQY